MLLLGRLKNQRTNALAYILPHSVSKKGFITLTLGANVMKPFFFIIYEWSNTDGAIDHDASLSNLA